MSASHAPAIASRGQVQGGRMDGTQGYVIDSRDTLLMVVAYKHPKTGALVAISPPQVHTQAESPAPPPSSTGLHNERNRT